MFPIPRYKELGVKPVWSLVSQVKELTDYFPDFKEKEVPDRSFLWGVLGNLKRDAWEQLLNEARAQRSAGAEQKQDELIQMDRSFLEKIMKAPNMSKGKPFLNSSCYFWHRERKGCIPIEEESSGSKIKEAPKRISSKAQPFEDVSQFWREKTASKSNSV